MLHQWFKKHAIFLCCVTLLWKLKIGSFDYQLFNNFLQIFCRIVETWLGCFSKSSSEQFVSLRMVNVSHCLFALFSSFIHCWVCWCHFLLGTINMFWHSLNSWWCVFSVRLIFCCCLGPGRSSHSISNFSFNVDRCFCTSIIVCLLVCLFLSCLTSNAPEFIVWEQNAEQFIPLLVSACFWNFRLHELHKLFCWSALGVVVCSELCFFVGAQGAAFE